MSFKPTTYYADRGEMFCQMGVWKPPSMGFKQNWSPDCVNNNISWMKMVQRALASLHSRIYSRHIFSHPSVPVHTAAADSPIEYDWDGDTGSVNELSRGHKQHDSLSTWEYLALHSHRYQHQPDNWGVVFRCDQREELVWGSLRN